MGLYNVEIFRRSEYICSTQLGELEYKEDYLSPEKNKIKTGQQAVTAKEGDYIRVRGTDIEHIGIVTQYDDTKTERVITYESFLTIFDVEIFCDPSELENTTLEDLIAKKIREYFIENEDSLQNIPGLTVEVLSGTAGSIELEKNICNLLDDIIIPIFAAYQVVVEPVWNMQNRTVTLQIMKAQQIRKTIETTLPNIFSKNIVIKKTKSNLNKVTVINEENTEEKVDVYRTTSNEITTENRDRITPVAFEVMTTKTGKDKTFQETAIEKAGAKLKKAEYENLIELEMIVGDSLVQPGEILLGQEVNVIDSGEVYKSILSGRQIKKNKETLVFGTIRIDLTKSIRRN